MVNERGHSTYWNAVIVGSLLILAFVVQDQVFAAAGLSKYKAQDGNSGAPVLCYNCTRGTNTPFSFPSGTVCGIGVAQEFPLSVPDPTTTTSTCYACTVAGIHTSTNLARCTTEPDVCYNDGTNWRRPNPVTCCENDNTNFVTTNCWNCFNGAINHISKNVCPVAHTCVNPNPEDAGPYQLVNPPDPTSCQADLCVESSGEASAGSCPNNPQITVYDKIWDGSINPTPPNQVEHGTSNCYCDHCWACSDYGLIPGYANSSLFTGNYYEHGRVFGNADAGAGPAHVSSCPGYTNTDPNQLSCQAMCHENCLKDSSDNILAHGVKTWLITVTPPYAIADADCQATAELHGVLSALAHAPSEPSDCLLVPDTCSDHVENGDETGIDCGGSCAPCPLGPVTTLFGSAAATEALQGATDGSNTFAVGAMNPTALTTGPNLIIQNFDNAHPGAYVAKFNPRGAQLWLVNLNGTVDDQGRAVAYAGGYVYSTGFTNASTFPVTAGAYQTTTGGAMDAFVTKLDTNGNIIWSTYLGGSSLDHGEGIGVDASGNVYVAGHTSSTNFPITSGIQGTNHGKNDTFLAKFNSSGGLVWSTYYGGANDDIVYPGGLAVDSSGAIIVTGTTYSSNYPTTIGAYSTTLSGTSDAFVSKFNSTGGVVWSTYFGGSGSDLGHQVTTDSSNYVYIVGETKSTNLPTMNAAQGSTGGNTDMFLTRFTSAGALSLSTYIGGANDDFGGAVAVSSIGNIYVAGITNSSGLETSDANLTYQGDLDGILRKYNSAGTLVHSTYLGGASADRALGAFVDPLERVMVVGDTNSSNFQVQTGMYQTTHQGKGDGFVATYNFYPAPSITTFDPTVSTNFTPVTVGDLHNVGNLTLGKLGGKVHWRTAVYTSLQDFDAYLKLGPNFVSMNLNGLDHSLNSSADITFTDIDCSGFRLYHATGFYSTAAALVAAGTLVATPSQVGGNCLDSSICTNVQCSGGTLTFRAQHFDGFGGGGAGAAVPEFSTWALLITACLTIGGLLFMRSRQ